MSCDGGSVNPKFGNGIAGGATGTSPITPLNPNSPDTNKPFVRIDTPLVGQLINVGDSILTVTRLNDDRQLLSVVVTGYKFTGSAILGTLTQTIRYTPAQAPVAGGTPFRAGLTDTLIFRYLKPAIPVDTSIDSLVIEAIVTDAAGNVDTARKRVNIVTGPKVTIEAPVANDSVSQGIFMLVRVHVTHPDGVASDTIHIRGETTWPAPGLDTTIVTTFTGTVRDVVISKSVLIPLNAPIRGRVTISSSAVDVNRNPGSTTPVVVFVRAAGTTIPRVTQIIPPRLELTDSITILANGDGIASVGFIVRDSVGTELKRFTKPLLPPLTSNVSEIVPVNLADSLQGRRVLISSFATDQAGVTGYSIKASLTGAQSDSNLASRDSSLIVFGHTFPLQRPGTIGDVEIDAPRGNVFLSNLDNNRLEIWQAGTWFPAGIPVGSAPWGIQRTATSLDSLIVANSGGTNISKVFIGTANPALMVEDLANRIRTRTAPLFEVREVLDAATSKISVSVSSPLLFSNRPQYIGQIASGRIYFSTKPTTEAPKGMIHYFEPGHPFPDLHSIINFKSAPTSPNFLVLNADSIFVRSATATSGLPDTVVVYDHRPDTNLVSDSARSPGSTRPCTFPPLPAPQTCTRTRDFAVGIGAAVARLKLGWDGNCPTASPTPCDSTGNPICRPNCSDIQLIGHVDITTVGYTDTSFVATSADRNWIAFGSANTSGAGIVFMSSPGFFSPVFSQTDLTNNAAEHVHGLALDSTGITVAAHGEESSFASRDIPFHLRLQGKFNTFTHGAGIAFHPAAVGAATVLPSERLAFVASDNASIAILDVAHFLSAGNLPLKTKLFGPLKATRPFPTDPPDVVLKLFGVATTGLIVVDVRAVNLKPVP
jgi:hypothetical protein